MGCNIIWKYEARLVLNGSEPNISPILSRDSNKGKYISSEQMDKYEREAFINDQAVPAKKTRG